MFKEKEKEKGNVMGGKEAGSKWRELDDGKRKPYLDAYKKAKEKYDKYLEEVEGIAPRTSSKKKERPTAYRTARVRAVCDKSKVMLGMAPATYKALGRVVEAFVEHLGKASNDGMKSEERRRVTVEILTDVLGAKKYGFLHHMDGYSKILTEAESAVEKEHEKRSKARKKKGEDEEEEEEKGKKATKKGKSSKMK